MMHDPVPGSALRPPAGWYLDPLQRHVYRYWDGAGWTDDVADGTSQPVASMTLAASPEWAFRGARSATSGAVGTVFVREPAVGMVELTGEFVPPGPLTALRIGLPILNGVGLLLLFGTIVAWFVSASDGSPMSPVAVAAALLGLGAVLAASIWATAVKHLARPTSVRVPMTGLTRVSVSLNWNHLAWILLIGIFALIPLLSGRRVLRVDVPMELDGQQRCARVVLRELHRGDADHLVARWRLGGAR